MKEGEQEIKDNSCGEIEGKNRKRPSPFISDPAFGKSGGHPEFTSSALQEQGNNVRGGTGKCAPPHLSPINTSLVPGGTSGSPKIASAKEDSRHGHEADAPDPPSTRPRKKGKGIDTMTSPSSVTPASPANALSPSMESQRHYPRHSQRSSTPETVYATSARSTSASLEPPNSRSVEYHCLRPDHCQPPLTTAPPLTKKDTESQINHSERKGPKPATSEGCGRGRNVGTIAVPTPVRTGDGMVDLLNANQSWRGDYSSRSATPASQKSLSRESRRLSTLDTTPPATTLGVLPSPTSPRDRLSPGQQAGYGSVNQATSSDVLADKTQGDTTKLREAHHVRKHGSRTKGPTASSEDRHDL